MNLLAATFCSAIPFKGTYSEACWNPNGPATDFYYIDGVFILVRQKGDMAGIKPRVFLGSLELPAPEKASSEESYTLF